MTRSVKQNNNNDNDNNNNNNNNNNWIFIQQGPAYY